MHAVKVDSRKIMAAALVIMAIFAAVAITASLFYLGQIESLVRNTTTTSVMELATARAHYLDECLTSDQNSVQSLAHFIADVTPQEARDQVEDFISTHKAAAAWIRSKDGATWCSSQETDLYDPALEEELFGPAMAGETGSSEMYLGHAGERRILFYAPIVEAPVAASPGAAAAPVSPNDVLGAVYVSYPADELQNSYGTTYSSAGATFVVDSSGTIVLDANRSSDDAVRGSLENIIADAHGDNAQVSQLLEGIASNSEGGSLVMTLDGTEQFVFYTSIAAKDGWSLVTILPLSVVESDGAKIVSITNQMTATLAAAVLLAAAAIAALVVYRRRREHRYEQYIQSVYSAIGANIDTAIFIVDRKERLVEAVFENTQDILGIPARDFFVPNELSPNEAYANVAAIVHSGAGDKARTWEFEADNPALGRSQWLRMTARPVMLAEREKTIFSLTDVTADHEIRARLERAATAAEDANRAKSSFLSSMSHDIRTPMNAILGFSTLIDREADNPAHVRDYNRKIATSGQHLLGLINDVLDMSKIEAGKTTLAASAFALSGTVESVEAMMRQQTDAKNQVFTVEVDKVEHDRLVGDEGRLRQILMNLLSNAMKYTPEGGHPLPRRRLRQAPRRAAAPAHHRPRRRHRHVEGLPCHHLRLVHPRGVEPHQQGSGNGPRHGHHEEPRRSYGRHHLRGKRAGNGQHLHRRSGLPAGRRRVGRHRGRRRKASRRRERDRRERPGAQARPRGGGQRPERGGHHRHPEHPRRHLRGGGQRQGGRGEVRDERPGHLRHDLHGRANARDERPRRRPGHPRDGSPRRRHHPHHRHDGQRLRRG